MSSQVEDHGRGRDGKKGGPRYYIDLEGDEREWGNSSITLAQLRTLAGWPADQQVVMVDLSTNEENGLDEGTPIDLKPGHGFGRKFKFRRGSR
jgi:Multiubiquitin